MTRVSFDMRARALLLTAIGGSLFACGHPEVPAAPTDPYAACTAATRDEKQRDVAIDFIEKGADVRVMATPLTEQSAQEVLGASSPNIGGFWVVTVEVRSLPAETHLAIKAPRFTRDCVESTVAWAALWPDTIARVFPDPPAPTGGDQPLPNVPPLYAAEPPPDKIEKGPSPLWEKLDAATHKAHSPKKAYRLTPKDKIAWETMEEARRAAAKEAHDAAAAERKKVQAANAERKAAYEAELQKVGAAREKISSAALPQCDHVESITPDEIVFGSPARCTYISIPASKPLLEPNKKCTAPTSLLVPAEWIVDRAGQPCMLDAAAARTFKGDAPAGEVLPKLFEHGPRALREIRSGR